jgi:hypothetical protein
MCPGFYETFFSTALYCGLGGVVFGVALAGLALLMFWERP